MVHIKYVDVERLNTPENSTMFDHPDDEVIIETKVDGGNGQFWIEDGMLHLGSRNRDMTVERDEKAFANQQKWLQSHLSTRLHLINPNYRFFIEWMARHTIYYGDKIPPVIGLDILPIEGAFGRKPLFLGRKAKEEEFAKLEIPCVALKGIFKVKELNDELYKKLTESSVYYSGKDEGCVVKNYGRTNVWGRQMFAKIVLDEFKETNRAVFGSAKKDTSDTIKIVESYCTPARVRKRILALTTEGGQSLDRKLMHLLPTAVCQDIFKEETTAILKNYKDMSFSVLKQLVAKRCLMELDAMIVEKMKVEG